MKTKEQPSTTATPSSFKELVGIVERGLKQRQPFVVKRPEGARAILKSLELRAVVVDNKRGAAGVRVVCDATFAGKYAPHEVVLTRMQEDELGVTDIQLGVGASPNENGTVDKGLSFRVLPKALAGELVEHATGLTSNPRLREQVRKLAALAADPVYRSSLLELQLAEEHLRASQAKVLGLRKRLAEMKTNALKETPATKRVVKQAAAAATKKVAAKKALNNETVKKAAARTSPRKRSTQATR